MERLIEVGSEGMAVAFDAVLNLAMWTDPARRQDERRGGRYANDLRGAECAMIEPFLPPARLGGRLRTTSLQ